MMNPSIDTLSICRPDAMICPMSCQRWPAFTWSSCSFGQTNLEKSPGLCHNMNLVTSVHVIKVMQRDRLLNTRQWWYWNSSLIPHYNDLIWWVRSSELILTDGNILIFYIIPSEQRNKQKWKSDIDHPINHSVLGKCGMWVSDFS